MTMASLPRALGSPTLSGRMRCTPDDFLVEEIDAFEASGSGEHLLLTIEKRGMNTAFAAKRIAAWAGVPEAGIGYAGLKDRHATTRQRISVHLPKKVAPEIGALESDALRVLDARWHSRKLPRGALAGNRFDLRLRDVAGDRVAIESRLHGIAARGVPNYFGEQRFGRDGDNIANAIAMFGGRRMRREQRGLLLSAARSELFNRVLATRVRQECWDRPLKGEVWMLDGNRSVFGPEPFTEGLASRLLAFDIHPTAPLWGQGESRAAEDAAMLEQSALQDPDASLLRSGLERAGLRQERRATRLRPGNLSWEWTDADRLRLRFDLPAGCYATVVLHALGDVVDAHA